MKLLPIQYFYPCIKTFDLCLIPSFQDREAVRADLADPECGDDPHHVCHASPLLHSPKHQPSEHQAAPTFR